MFNLNLCSATNKYGKECMGPVVEGAPVNMCMNHIMQVGSFWSEMKASAESGKPRFTEAQMGRKQVGYEAQDTAVVYYIIHGNRVKIGTSRNWRERLRQLPCDRVLALEPGSEGVETERHLQFASTRIENTEWFDESDDLWDHVTQVSESHPDLTAKANAYNQERSAARKLNRRQRGFAKY